MSLQAGSKHYRPLQWSWKRYHPLDAADCDHPVNCACPRQSL